MRTYVDAGVLIAAWQGEGEVAVRALELLEDPDRTLIGSQYLQLEVLPKPIFNRRADEVAFHNLIFERMAEIVESSPKVSALATALASQCDLEPMDALHAAAAIP